MSDITFNTIPVSMNTPGAYIEVDGSRANLGLPVPRRRTVIIGQRLASGTAAINTLTRVDTIAAGKVLAGQGSMLARMIELYKLNDSTTELWIVPVNDLVGGSKASMTYTVSAQPTAAGTLFLRLTDQAIPVAVAAGQSTASIATAIGAAINANPDLPVSATVVGSVVTITCDHKGTLGNGLDFRLNYNPGETTPAGFAATPTAFTGGAGAPDITTALAAIGDEPFATFVHAYTDSTNLSAIEAFLATRFDGLHQNDGLAFTAAVDTLGNLETLGLSRNSPFAPIGGIKGLPNPFWELAAAMAGQVAASGTIDPAQPLTGLALTGIHAPAIVDRFIRQEREYLLADGISTFTIDGNGAVCIERMVTTYTLNAQGLPDTAFRDVNTMLTLAYLRFSRRYMILTTFPRYKLGNDGTAYNAGQKIATPSSIKAAIIAQYKQWIGAGLIEDKLDVYKAALVVSRDRTDVNRINTIDSPDLMNQFLVFASQIQFTL